jgi:hypothetical protein
VDRLVRGRGAVLERVLAADARADARVDRERVRLAHLERVRGGELQEDAVRHLDVAGVGDLVIGVRRALGPVAVLDDDGLHAARERGVVGARDGVAGELLDGDGVVLLLGEVELEPL